MLRVLQPRSKNSNAGACSPRDPGLSGASGLGSARGAGGAGQVSKPYEGGKIEYGTPEYGDLGKQLDYSRPYDSKVDYQIAFDTRQVTPRPTYSARADVRGLVAATPRHRPQAATSTDAHTSSNADAEYGPTGRATIGCVCECVAYRSI